MQNNDKKLTSRQLVQLWVWSDWWVSRWLLCQSMTCCSFHKTSASYNAANPLWMTTDHQNWPQWQSQGHAVNKHNNNIKFTLSAILKKHKPIYTCTHIIQAEQQLLAKTSAENSVMVQCWLHGYTKHLGIKDLKLCIKLVMRPINKWSADIKFPLNRNFWHLLKLWIQLKHKFFVCLKFSGILRVG